MSSEEKPWYKKARYIIPALAGIALLYGASASQTAPSQSQVASVTQTVAHVSETPSLPTVNPYDETSVKPVSPPAIESQTKTEQLSNNNYYTNVSGNTVHSPAYTTDTSVPAGASAQCRDGTYSFSQHHSGTCSHHGGVSKWL